MSTSFVTARAAGAPSKTKPCQTCELLGSLTGPEAQALRETLADAAWSLAATSDLIERVTGKRIKQSALWRHTNMHTEGRN